MGVYTHIGLNDQRTAIESLPAPPELGPTGSGTPPNGNETTNGAANHQLDAQWAELPEDVKAALLASVNAKKNDDPSSELLH